MQSESTSIRDGSQRSSLQRMRRRLAHGDAFQRARHYSFKRRKPIGIAAVTILFIVIVLTVILVLVLRKGGKSHAANPRANPDAKAIVFLFNIGYKETTAVTSRLSLVRQPDEGRAILKKAIIGLGANITSGKFFVNLIPYADSVLKDKVRLNVGNVDDALKIVDQIFADAPPLKNNPSQFEAVSYFANAQDIKTDVNEEVFSILADTNKQDGNFVFLAPKERLYDTVPSRIEDSQQTGQLFHSISNKISKTFIVGLDNNKNMASDYGVEDADIQVLPDGVNDVDKIVDDIKNDKPTVIATTTTTKKKPPPPSTSTSTASTTTTIKTTTTLKPKPPTTKKPTKAPTKIPTEGPAPTTKATKKPPPTIKPTKKPPPTESPPTDEPPTDEPGTDATDPPVIPEQELNPDDGLYIVVE